MIIKTVFYKKEKKGFIIIKGFNPALTDLYRKAGYKVKFIYDSLN
jgi:hypothetical protein